MLKFAAASAVLFGILLLMPVRSQDKATPVRPLVVKPDPDALPLGGSGVKLYTSADMVTKELGAFVAKQITSQVDYKKEQLVHVQWFSGGPPFGSLRHEQKATGLVFYVQGPPRGKARGEAARLGSDFFAIPLGAKVTFDPKER